MEELVKTLQTQVADAKAANDKLEEISAGLLAKNQALEIENAELKAKLSACKCGGGTEAAAAAPVVKIGDTEYQYTGPSGFILEGRRYSAEEALAEPAVLHKILALPGQSYLKELV